MRIASNNSKISNSIILVLLVISILGTFFSLHNQLTQAQGKTPLIAVVLVILTITLGVWLFLKLLKQINEFSQNKAELENLKRTIRESRESKEKEEKAKQAKQAEKQVNHEEVAKKLLPIDKFDDQEKFIEKLLSNIAKEQDVVQAIAFIKNTNSNKFEMLTSYAYYSESEPPTFVEGETLPGQVAKNQTVLNLTSVPDDYITVLSGLGKGSPNHLLIVPVIAADKTTIGILEFASFSEFTNDKVKICEHLGLMLHEHLSSISNSTEE